MKTKHLYFSAILMLIAFGASFLLVACDWKADGLERIKELYPTETEDGDLDEDIPEDELGEVEGEGLAGQWAMMLKLDGEFNPIGSIWNIEITNLFLVEVNDDETEMTLTFCDQLSKVTSGDKVLEDYATSMEQATKDAIGAVPISIELPGDGSVPAQSLVWTWALNLENPRTDDISDIEAGDPRAFDMDNDGKPGVTMKVGKSGERYMVRRAFWEWEAAAMSEDKQYVEAPIAFTLDEFALGAQPAIFATVAPISEKEESASRFVLRRLAGTDAPEDGDDDAIDGDEPLDGDEPIDGDATDGDLDAVDGDVDAEAELEADTEADVEIDGDVEAETELEADVEVEAEIEADVEIDGDTDVEAESDAEVDGDEETIQPPRIRAEGYTCEQLIKTYKSMFANH